MQLPEPKFEEFSDDIKATVYRANGDRHFDIDRASDIGENVGETVDDVGENVEENLANENEGDTKNRILHMVLTDNKVSAASIAQAVSVTRRTVERYIRELREEDVLIRHGAARGGYWEVLKRGGRRGLYPNLTPKIADSFG